jgi:hypothetical protein
MEKTEVEGNKLIKQQSPKIQVDRMLEDDYSIEHFLNIRLG